MLEHDHKQENRTLNRSVGPVRYGLKRLDRMPATKPLCIRQNPLGNQSSLRFARSCNMDLTSPQICLFGCICHTCPAQVQTRLKIGPSKDKHEQEANRVADQIMRMPESEKVDAVTASLPTSGPCAHPTCTTGAQKPSLKASESEKIILQGKAASGRMQVVPNMENKIASLQGKGQPLSVSIRKYFEPRFRHDFSGVRIHTDSIAAQLNIDLHSEAFTHGGDIYFNEGKYRPYSSEGRRLLAHELCHTLQQSATQDTMSVQRTVFIRNQNVNARLEYFITDHEDDFSDIISGVGGGGARFDFVGSERYRRNLLNRIVGNMRDVDAHLDYDSEEEFIREIRRRAFLVLFMRASQGETRATRPTGYPSNCPPAMPRIAAAAQRYGYWIIHPATGRQHYAFTLTTQGQRNAYHALQTLILSHTNTDDDCLRSLLHCDYLISALHYLAMAEVMGRGEFDRAVGSGEIELELTTSAYLENIVLGGSGATRMELRSLRQVWLDNEDELIIGDHVFFYNHDAYDDLNYRNGRPWRLENAVVIGGTGTNRRFQGHGFYRPRLRHEMINQMADHFNYLVNLALSNRQNFAFLASNFSFPNPDGSTFWVVSNRDTTGREVQWRIYYHIGMDPLNTTEGPPRGQVSSIPLRQVTQADYPNPLIRPGLSRILVFRPIESMEPVPPVATPPSGEGGCSSGGRLGGRGTNLEILRLLLP